MMIIKSGHIVLVQGLRRDKIYMFSDAIKAEKLFRRLKRFVARS